MLASRTGSPRGAIAALAATALLGAGCAKLALDLTYGDQFREAEALAELSGEVSTAEPGAGPVVVVLLREQDGELQAFSYQVLESSGRWKFFVIPGTYAVGAFLDLDSDLVYQPGEPVHAPRDGESFELAEGEHLENLAIAIPASSIAGAGRPVDIAAEQVPPPELPGLESLERHTVRGERASLDDPRFDPENAKKGLHKPLDFIRDPGLGVYFLEPYDPRRSPVLFVHGISGSPRQFSFLIEWLDRRRFQPWVYQYPSGLELDLLGEHLGRVVTELRVRHGFRHLRVVAHSMGGLVARSFIQQHHAASGRDTVDLLVSISTPWGGAEWASFARLGAEHGLAVLPAWVDIAPDSDFLNGLFFQGPKGDGERRRLPEHVSYHLFFGYRGSALDPASDGVIPLRSQLRREAREEAGGRAYPFDSSHTGILENPDTSARLNAILARAGH
jgi:pimeloyl-ACP methyl ester carboxylesterase